MHAAAAHCSTLECKTCYRTCAAVIGWCAVCSTWCSNPGVYEQPEQREHSPLPPLLVSTLHKSIEGTELAAVSNKLPSWHMSLWHMFRWCQQKINCANTPVSKMPLARWAATCIRLTIIFRYPSKPSLRNCIQQSCTWHQSHHMLLMCSSRLCPLHCTACCDSFQLHTQMKACHKLRNWNAHHMTWFGGLILCQ